MDYPLAHRLGWMLLHSLWQGALVGLIFGVVRFTLRRRSANARYLAGCLGLSLLVAAPALTVFYTSGPSTQFGATPSAGAFDFSPEVPLFSAANFQRFYVG